MNYSYLGAVYNIAMKFATRRFLNKMFVCKVGEEYALYMTKRSKSRKLFV